MVIPLNLVDGLALAVQALSLSMARLLGCSLFFPLLGRRHLAALNRNAVCLALSLAQALTVWEGLSQAWFAGQTPLVPFWLLGGKEVVIGCLLGSLLAIPFWVIRGAFTLIDNQRGANAAQMNNPAMEADSSLLGELAERVLIVMLIEMGIYLMAFEVVADSYRLWPLLSVWPVDLAWGSSHATHAILQAFTQLLRDTVMYASPMLLLLLLIEWGMAISSSAVQGIDVYQIGMPIKSLSALAVLIVSAPMWLERAIESIQNGWGPGIQALLGAH